MAAIKLKTHLTSQAELDAVPERYRSRYTPSDDGKNWTLDELEIEDVDGLKSNSEQLLKEKRKLTADMKALQEKIGDLDVERAREALEKVKELEEKDLMGKGKIDELLEKRFASKEKTYQSQLEKMNNTLAGAAEREQKLLKQLANTSRSGQLGKALIEAQVDPKWFEFVEMKAEKIWQWQMDEKGEGALVPMEGEAPLFVDGKVPDMKTWISAVVAKARPEIILSSSGGGANGNTYRGGPQAFLITRETGKDIAKVERIIAEAAKAGAQVQYE